MILKRKNFSDTKKKEKEKDLTKSQKKELKKLAGTLTAGGALIGTATGINKSISDGLNQDVKITKARLKTLEKANKVINLAEEAKKRGFKDEKAAQAFNESMIKAKNILEKEVAANEKFAKNSQKILRGKTTKNILTHGGTGALIGAGVGTGAALGLAHVIKNKRNKK